MKPEKESHPRVHPSLSTSTPTLNGAVDLREQLRQDAQATCGQEGLIGVPRRRQNTIPSVIKITAISRHFSSFFHNFPFELGKKSYHFKYLIYHSSTIYLLPYNFLSIHLSIFYFLKKRVSNSTINRVSLISKEKKKMIYDRCLSFTGRKHLEKKRSV